MLHGTWASPISAELVSQSTRDLTEPMLAADGIYWLESQPDGRSSLRVRRPDGTVTERLPGIDVRTGIHAYGGGAYVVDGNRLLYTDAKDQRLYVITGDAPARVVTPPGKAWHAGCVIDDRLDRAFCVREDASGGGLPVDSIVVVDLSGATRPVPIVTGNDFYAQLRISPDGRSLAWLSWTLPNMPWDGTDLWVSDIADDGVLGPATHVAGGPHDSISQPEWAADGDLYFASDRTGYWNLYRRHRGAVEPIWPLEGELGRPAWNLDDRGYGFASATEIVAAITVRGQTDLRVFDIVSRKSRPIAPGYTVAHTISAGTGHALAIMASPREPLQLVDIEVARGTMRVLARSTDAQFDAGLIPHSEEIAYPTAAGEAYGVFYPPLNPTVRVPTGELPPLIVAVHGGPTDYFWRRLDPEIVFFTSRGFAVVKVDHGGSTGYGRRYRERLNGQWGVVDVDDSIAAAKSLVARGLVDAKRIVIRGGSAGGFTTLAALASRTFFRAGAAYFGISDLERLRNESAASNKFESDYMTQLIGPYPERKDLYVARSPLFAAAKITAPVIFFQGADDPVVLPNQSRLMHEAVKANKLPTAFLEFAGEKHGFRKATTKARSLEAELYFYQRVLGIPTTGAPIEIDNLP